MTIITGRIVRTSTAGGGAAVPVPNVGQLVLNAVALRALVGSATLPAVALKQLDASAPVGGGYFYWSALAATDDGYYAFNAGGLGSSSAGWRRVMQPSEPYDARAFGPIGLGADDTTALQAALTAAAGRTLFLPPGATYKSQSLMVPADTFISAYGATLDFSSANMKGLQFNGGGGIYGATLLGHDGTTYDAAGIAIAAQGTSNSPAAPTFIKAPIVQDCTIQNWSAYGIYLQFTERADIQRNKFTSIGYAAVGGVSCNDCVADYNDISDVNGGAADAYGIFFDRSNGTSETATPRSYRCSMSHNNISDITTAANSQGIDSHAGVDMHADYNTIRNCGWGVVFVSSPLGADPMLAPQRGTIIGNNISCSGSGAGVIVSGATIYGFPGSENARGVVVSGNTITNGGTPNSVAEGAIRIQSTESVSITGNTLVEPNVTGIHVTEENYGFTITGNTIVDPHDGAQDCNCVKIHGNNNTGNVSGNTLQLSNTGLDTKVAEYAIFTTSGRTGTDVHIGQNTYLGMTASRLRIEANADTGIRCVQPNDAAEFFGGDETFIVGVHARTQFATLSPRISDTLVTLSLPNAVRGSRFRIVRYEPDVGGPWVFDVGPGLINLVQGDWCECEFDGTAWQLAATGTLPDRYALAGLASINVRALDATTSHL